jgi:murein L,D-transpeptidase YcbB/YkuD
MTDKMTMMAGAAAALALTASAAYAGPVVAAAETLQAGAAGSRAPTWDAAAEAQLSAAIADAARHGLSPQAFSAKLPEAGAADRDARLSEAAMAYARALATGATDPAKIFGIYTLARPEPDLADGMATAIREGRLQAWLAGLAPQDAEYRALSDAYLREARRISQDPPPPIGEGPLIRAGDRDPRIPQIRARLDAEGFAADKPPEQGDEVYGAALAEAVRSFQTARGISRDGVVGPETLEQLNRGPRARATQLAVNLERRRWLVRNPPPTRIDVNVAAAQLAYYRQGERAWSTRVVAGSPGHETPQLQETFSQLVVNPPWYVPASIAQEEILPKGQAYLARHDMYVDDGRVIQRPGPQAALGQVKFDMQNRYAIYLHDTPAKALFDASDRHRSHGCVRVQDAVAFARRLAEEHGEGEAFDQQLQSGNTGVVELGGSVPVRLLYHTAVRTSDGEVVVRSDPYGWDERVASALGLPSQPRLPGARKQPEPLSP